MLTEQLFLAGKAELAIQRELEARFGVSDRQARRYLQRVRAKLDEARGTNPGAARMRAETLLLEALEVARQKRQGSLIARIASRLADLDGALVRRLEHSGPGGGPFVHGTPALFLPEKTDEGEGGGGGD